MKAFYKSIARAILVSSLLGVSSYSGALDIVINNNPATQVTTTMGFDLLINNVIVYKGTLPSIGKNITASIPNLIVQDFLQKDGGFISIIPTPSLLPVGDPEVVQFTAANNPDNCYISVNLASMDLFNLTWKANLFCDANK